MLGVFGVGSLCEDTFTGDDVSFLGQLAKEIAIAVENALPYNEISRSRDRLALENVYLESEI